MKRKIRMFFSIVTLSVLMCYIVTLAGSNYASFKFDSVNAYCTAFISFTEGPLLFPDKISYTLELIGADREKVGVPYEIDIASINKKTQKEDWTLLNYNFINIISELNISNGYTTSMTDISIGLGHTGARAQVKIINDTKYVEAR